MKLLIQYFKTSNYKRDAEYLYCLKKNVANPFITKIYVFLEDESHFNNFSDKITCVNIGKRCSYNDFFKFSNENLKGNICIISNSDIIFDHSLAPLNNFDMTQFFLCLTRWDIKPDGSLEFYNEPCSQDCWIFKAPLPPEMNCDAFLGTPGCDNLVSFAASRAGLITNNPSELIITKHLHLSGFRTYDHRMKPKGCAEHLFSTNSLSIISKKEYLEI